MRIPGRAICEELVRVCRVCVCVSRAPAVAVLGPALLGAQMRPGRGRRRRRVRERTRLRWCVAGRRAGRTLPLHSAHQQAAHQQALPTHDYQRTVMPRYEGAAKQLMLMTLLLVCGRHSMIAAEPALPGYSPNMCMDVKDRYDVDLWRRKSGSIRFPIGAWSSPIGVYSRGTPAILAAYASANFSVLEISGGALGPVDPLTQVRLTLAQLSPRPYCIPQANNQHVPPRPLAVELRHKLDTTRGGT